MWGRCQQANAWEYLEIEPSSGEVSSGKTGAAGGLYYKNNSVLLAKTDNSVAGNANKQVRDAVVIGTNSAYASGSGSTVVGSGAYSTKQDSTVIGINASATENSVVAVGKGAKGVGGQATAIGSTTYAKAQATAVGADVYASGASSIALGNDDIAAGASNDWGNVISNAEGYIDRLPEETIKKIYSDYTGDFNNAVTPTHALGGGMTWTEFSKKYIRNRDCNQDKDQRIYSPTFAKGIGSIAIGSRSVASAAVSTTLGTLSFALAKNSTAIGLRTYADFNAEGATAIGQESRVFAPNTLAIGNKSEATNIGSLAFGANSRAVGSGAVAIGENVLSNAKLSSNSENTFLDRLKQQAIYTKDGNSATVDDVTVGDNNPIVQAGFKANQSTPKAGLQTVSQRISALLASDFKFEVEKDRDVIITTTEEVKKTKKEGDHAVSVGYYVHNSGDNSVGIGTGSAILGDNSVGIGALTYISKEAFNSMAIGVGTSKFRCTWYRNNGVRRWLRRSWYWCFGRKR
ncbi:YadA domain-containing protein [Canicola haemoglobinophilus]|uniref:YadA domain-containing protein n=1 Tax=Canicola haemoglobinophilus TaxID=733 RepID=A0AB38HCV2_9PAST|nr:hypothetical protein [Canicola haemoglobinophilus]STO55057.1 YadA domain-containing protein [Canicola haemoglobinophilus]STO69372.1 YadA domain-containing protein [Canicola haemoglobinophilus]